MKILFCGDVVGETGRKAVTTHIPVLRNKLSLDAVTVNGENSAGGFGITKSICEEFLRSGVDVITSGDHVWDQKETTSFIDNYPKLLRPINFPKKTPGKGSLALTLNSGKILVVIQALGQVFMKYQLDSPFEAIDEELEKYKLGGNVHAIVVDMHAEASSEKTAMGHYLNGRVSLVVGSHTHIPTSDYQILSKGTAYQTDAGMCGDYNSVIGFDPQIPLKSFLQKMKSDRMTPATGEATLCGIYVETDDSTGLAKHIEPIRVGGRIAKK